MSNKIIIKNGRIITAVDNYKADIIIENEKIDCIGNKLNPSSDYMVIDARFICFSWRG